MLKIQLFSIQSFINLNFLKGVSTYINSVLLPVSNKGYLNHSFSNLVEGEYLQKLPSGYGKAFIAHCQPLIKKLVEYLAYFFSLAYPPSVPAHCCRMDIKMH